MKNGKKSNPDCRKSEATATAVDNLHRMTFLKNLRPQRRLDFSPQNMLRTPFLFQLLPVLLHRSISVKSVYCRSLRESALAGARVGT
jgi:hypothetical protein